LEAARGWHFHRVGHRTRIEREADFFALCAIIPKSWMEMRSIDEIIEDEGIPADLVEARFAILRRYGV